MKKWFSMVGWLVFVFISLLVSPCVHAGVGLDELDKKYEEAKAKLQEPLESLRESYRKHLASLHKEFAASGQTVAAGRVVKAAKAGDPDPADLSSSPKLQEAQKLFLASKVKILEEIKAPTEVLKRTYLEHLEETLKALPAGDPAFSKKIAALREELGEPPAVVLPSTLRGSYHCCVDDSASLYINGERVLRAKLGNNQSDVVEISVGDYVVFSARNGGGGAKCFKVAFVSEDDQHVINFKAPILKVIPDGTKKRKFPIEEIEAIETVATVMPGSGSGITADFPFAEDSDWVWDEGSHSIFAALITQEMIRSTAKSDVPLVATKTLPVKPLKPKLEPIPVPLPEPMPVKVDRKPAPGFVDNIGAEWPTSASTDVSAEVTTVKEDAAGEEFIYHSKHFEFVCDARLSLNVIRKLSRLFEASLEYCKALPIATQKAHTVGGENLHRILLFKEESDYFKNGGPPGSAGVFIGGRNIVMVPLKHVGVLPAGSGYRVDYDKKNKTLPHEIVHQLTDSCYYEAGARGWFTEGLAEYVAMTPYSNSGTFKIRGNREPIMLGVTAYGEDNEGGRNLGEKISMRPLSEWMKMSYDEFTGPDIGKNYGMGALVVYYFFHMDRDGDRTAINAFLRGLRAGKSGQAALDELLGGRSWTEMAEEIKKGWRSRGVEINWDRESSSASGD